MTCSAGVPPAFPSPAQRPARRRHYTAAVLFLFLVTEAAMACPVCYGDPNSPMVKGTNNGILFLLGVVGILWVGFAALFLSFWMRARALRRRREEFHLIEGGVH